MQQSETITELAAALAAFQSEMPKLEKSADNPFFKSKYVELATVMEKALPLTSKNGLAIVQMPGINKHNEEVLYTQLTHKSGQWMRSCMKLHMSKNDAQGQGSALTYAKRYAAMAALGIVADDDDDGNAASKKRANSVPTAKKDWVEFAQNWEIKNLQIAARKVIGNKPDAEVNTWLEKTLNVTLTKMPRAWVQPAMEKIAGIDEVSASFGDELGGEEYKTK